jgi:hypothetical protein
MSLAKFAALLLALMKYLLGCFDLNYDDFCEALKTTQANLLEW